MSTHKYLDTTGLGQVWGKIKNYADPFVVTISGSSPNYTSDKTYAEIETAYNSGKRCICIITNVIYVLSQVNNTVTPSFVRFSTLLTISESNTTGEKKAAMRSVIIKSDGTIEVTTMMGANSSDVLSKYNTTSYTPTGDYNPATKKYVDDFVNGFSTTLSGLSDTTITAPSDGQGLFYDSTTSKWINSAINNSEPEDDINIINLLAEYDFVAPIEDADGYVITDVDDNLIVI